MKASNSQSTDQSYYDILEVPVSAGPSEIYQAYQRAKATYSPSSPALYSMFTPEEASQLSGLIEEAYQTLSNKSRRHAYDISIGLIQAPPHTPTPSARPMPRFDSPMPAPQPVSMKPVAAPPPPAPMPAPVPRAAAPEGDPFARPTQAPAARGEDTWVGQVRIVKRKDDLPAGFARTKFSVYEIKPEIEEEIKLLQECDGQFLQKLRLYKGVTLEQLSEEIKVGKSLLIALEANDTDALPIAVFTRGFVVQMAKVLMINEKLLADAYMKYFKARKAT